MKDSLKGLKDRRTYIIAYIVILVVSALFYLTWYWNDGVILTEDANSYINMQSDREPGYCSFLWILRSIFGTGNYLDVAAIIQCLIAAIAAAAITTSFWRRFSLNWFSGAAILVIQYGVTLLNRFVALRRYSYYNSIETEGLAYSIWVFFFLGLIGIIYDRNKKSIIMTLIWSVILISIRKQMLVTLCLLFVCLLFIWFGKKNWKRAVLEAVLIVAVGLAGTKFVDCTYNFALRGVFAPHTGDSSFILGTELFLADEDMVHNIREPEYQEIFKEIMRRNDEKQYNIAYAGKGWHNIEDHYSNSYDRIKFDIVNVVIREYQEEQGIPEEQREDSYNEIAGTIMKELLVPCIPNLIKLFFCNVIHGLITTVLKVNTILNWVALGIYIMYIALIVFIAIMRKQRGETGISVLPLAVLVLVAILANVCLTSVTIYCQMRYMLYNTGLFYQAGLLLVIETKKLKAK